MAAALKSSLVGGQQTTGTCQTAENSGHSDYVAGVGKVSQEDEA